MNSKTIQKPSSNKLYVAHSVKQKSEKKKSLEQTKTAYGPVLASQVHPYQYASRGYYHDTVGGGYQGL